jgi:hypothetical protein
VRKVAACSQAYTGFHTVCNTTFSPPEKQTNNVPFAFWFQFGVLPPRHANPPLGRSLPQIDYCSCQAGFGLRSVCTYSMCRPRLKAPLFPSPGSSKRGPCSHACMVQEWPCSNIASKVKGLPAKHNTTQLATPAQPWFPVHRPKRTLLLLVHSEYCPRPLLCLDHHLLALYFGALSTSSPPLQIWSVPTTLRQSHATQLATYKPQAPRRPPSR